MDLGATGSVERVSEVPHRRGLTSAEAEERRRRGEGNAVAGGGSRTHARILRTNVFNFYNTILFVIGAALLALGRYNDAFVSVGLGLVNAALSAAQEIRAKRKLDQLQLLSQGVVHVLRDGRNVPVPPEHVVRDDVIRVRPGDQVVVDGPVIDGRVEVDESLLTGESEALLKQPGDDLLSGSFCVGGKGHQLAREVGPASYANRLTADARRDSSDVTPLQRRIEFVVRLVMALVALMSATILLQAALEGFTLVRVVQTTAVLSGLVPYGLFFLVAVAYTVGAAKSGGRGALVQRVNAVEWWRCGRSGSTEPRTPSGWWVRRPAAPRRPTSPRRRWPQPCPAMPGPSRTRSRSPRRCGGARCAPTTPSGCWARPRPWPNTSAVRRWPRTCAG
jgi:cation-transporting ATPase E